MPRTVTVADLSSLLGVSRQAVASRAAKEGWRATSARGRGGAHLYLLESLPEDLQRRVSGEEPHVVSLNIEAAKRGITLPNQEAWASGREIGPAAVADPRVAKLSEALAEVQRCPKGQKKRPWIEAVALRYGYSWQHLYRALKKYESQGLAGLVHARRGQTGGPEAWDQDALDYWIGLCAKRECRKKSRKSLYEDCLEPEAQSRGWKIGSLRSAYEYAQAKITPTLRAYRDGGLRALDNALPPILRDYSDLNPFQIIVGDQHRFDFWVIDEGTGELCRPEGYFWQDLRTRAFYGGAVDRKYDSHLMALALRIGLRAFGAFDCVYTDHGQPERAKHIEAIVRDVQQIGLRHQYAEVSDDLDGDEPQIQKVGHRWAIVRNAKAKLIEKTFREFERVLRDKMGVPGYVKRLGGPAEQNEVDAKEVARLARSGKLLTASEFRLAMYRAMDFWNREKHHRGAAREWSGPKPKTITPLDVLARCVRGGWQPRWVSPEAVDLIFLDRAQRTVDRGRITLGNEFYQAEALIPLHGQKVDLRFDPFDCSEVLVFRAGSYLCRALPVEKGSMLDPEKTSRLIEQKRRWRKDQVEEYRRLTAGIADPRALGQSGLVPIGLEKDGKKAQKDRQIDQAQKTEILRTRTENELAAEVDDLKKPWTPPVERPIFRDAEDRMTWIVDQLAEGLPVPPEDLEFLRSYWADLSEGGRQYWTTAADVYGVDLPKIVEA